MKWNNLLLAVTGLIFVVTACDKQATPVSEAATQATNTTAVATATPKPEYQKLVGKWERPDGGYVLELRSVNEEGVFEAGYFNPSPIRVERALAYSEGGKTKVMAILRDVNYPGCTYKLTYDPASDQLFGEYFQAAMGETYQITFGRLK